MNTWPFETYLVWAKQDFWSSLFFVGQIDDLTIWKVIIGNILGVLEFTIHVKGEEPFGIAVFHLISVATLNWRDIALLFFYFSDDFEFS